MRKLMPIILLAFALVVGTWFGHGPKQHSPPLRNALRIDFIDVGQGDSIFIQTPDGASALIDAGEDEYGAKVVAHLRKAGVRKLNLVIMSHPHSDHIGGMRSVLQTFSVGSVLDSGYAHGSALQRSILGIIKKKNIPFAQAKTGLVKSLGSKARIEILAPTKPLMHGTRSDANNNSVICRVVYGGVRILLMGDAEHEEQGRLLASGIDLESQVLKVSHHGSDDGTSLELIRLVKPEYAIISVGAGNEYGHPHKSVLKMLATERTGAKIYRTDLNGTITIFTDGRLISVETEK